MAIYQLNLMLKTFLKFFKKGVDKKIKIWYYVIVPHGTLQIDKLIYWNVQGFLNWI